MQVEEFAVDAAVVPVAPPYPAMSPEAPSFVYTPDGVFFVPHWYIERDKNLPVHIKASVWRDLQTHHRKFAAVNFLLTTSVRAENIVVLSLPDPRNPHGRYKRVHWYLRLAILGGNTAFEEPFGCNFLWQLPYGTCTKIVQEIKAFESLNEVPDALGSSLTRALRPTAQDMKVSDWKDMRPVTRLDSYYDKMLVMSIRPVKRTVASPCDNPLPRLLRFDRQLRFQSPRHSRLNSAKIPDDVFGLILQTAADRWSASNEPSDWRALLKLRAVSRGARAHVEKAASGMLKGLLDKVKSSINTGCVSDIVDARDAILDAGLMTLPLVCDTRNPSFINLARLRTNRRPGSLPPPKPTLIESAWATRSFNTNGGDSFEDQKKRKMSDGKLWMMKETAHIRRTQKRRRILLSQSQMMQSREL